MRLLEPDVWNLGAVAGVPAKRRPSGPSGAVDQEQDELERVGEADEVELGLSLSARRPRCRSRGRRKRVSRRARDPLPTAASLE